MDLKPIDALSADELRRELAERQGYEWHLLTDDAAPLDNAFKGDLWTRDGELASPPPNWPEETGAALELCLQIAGEFEAEVCIKPAGRITFAEIRTLNDKLLHSSTSAPDCPPEHRAADALSRLALTALRARDKEREP